MNHNRYNNNEGSFLTFVVGALTGAAAVMFLDKDMRNKVENKLLEARLKGEETVEQAKSKVEETRDKLEDKAQEKLSQTQDKLDERKARRENNPNNNT